MKKANILSPKIEQILRKKENHNLFIKLKSMKPLINIDCPESFLFYQTTFHSKKKKKNIGNQKTFIIILFF